MEVIIIFTSAIQCSFFFLIKLDISLKNRSQLFPHHLTCKYNVMIILCDCFCACSLGALPAGTTSTSSIQTEIAWSS